MDYTAHFDLDLVRQVSGGREVRNGIIRECTICTRKVMLFPSQAKRTMNTFCSTTCYDKYKEGKGNPNWRGGVIQSGKYKQRMVAKQKYVQEHVYIYCKHWGIPYPLPPGFLVHHIDLDPTNNDIENLMLMTQPHHVSFHASLQGVLRERKQ